MPRRKDPKIPDPILDQLLAGAAVSPRVRSGARMTRCSDGCRTSIVRAYRLPAI